MSSGKQRYSDIFLQWLTLLTVISVPGTGWSAPITFNTALPVASNEYLARVQFIVNQSGNDPSTLDRDRTAKTTATVLGYGVSSKLAVFGVLPYRDNEIALTTGGQRVTRSATGIGDFTMFGRYTIVQRDQRGRNFRLAPFIGIKAPTGDDNKSDALGELPASVQPGSGSWDPLFGVITTYQTLKYQIDGQIGYQINNEANSFEAGNVAKLDGSFQYRFWPSTLKGHVPGFLYGVIEANLIYQKNNRVNGNSDPNSGGTRFFLAPGVQYVTRRWIVESTIQIPIVQNLNGVALNNDYIARLSGRFNF